MRIFISADIEGVAGVVHPDQARPGTSQYEVARHLMTEEVNAAIHGAIAGGATAIVVNDGHWTMRTLVLGSLDSRARLVSGWPRQKSMLQGLDADFDGVFMLGYHARAGSVGVLAHTINGFAFAEIRINDQPAGEVLLYGAVAGSIGVPVVLVTGDDRLAVETAESLPGTRFAEVKKALGAYAALSLSPEAARRLIREEAEQAVRAAGVIAPLRLEMPIRCLVRLNSQALTDLVEILPMCERLDATRVAFVVAGVDETVRVINVMAAMSASLR